MGWRSNPPRGNAVKDYSGIAFARSPTRFRPPLPRERCGPCPMRFAGERAGVRGQYRSLRPPHPGPLPHSRVLSKSSAECGGEGAEHWETPRGNPSRRCPLGSGPQADTRRVAARANSESVFTATCRWKEATGTLISADLHLWWRLSAIPPHGCAWGSRTRRPSASSTLSFGVEPGPPGRAKLLLSREPGGVSTRSRGLAGASPSRGKRTLRASIGDALA